MVRTVSLLGTWSGRGSENWDAAHSSLLQLFVSIQGLILVPKPYFLEAGYVHFFSLLSLPLSLCTACQVTNSATGMTSSRARLAARSSRASTTRTRSCYLCNPWYFSSLCSLSLSLSAHTQTDFCQISLIKRPPPPFQELIMYHFHSRRDGILSRCQRYLKIFEEKTVRIFPPRCFFLCLFLFMWLSEIQQEVNEAEDPCGLACPPSSGFIKMLQTLLPRLSDTLSSVTVRDMLHPLLICSAAFVGQLWLIPSRSCPRLRIRNCDSFVSSLCLYMKPHSHQVLFCSLLLCSCVCSFFFSFACGEVSPTNSSSLLDNIQNQCRWWCSLSLFCRQPVKERFPGIR